jgi:hypothetical protein
MEEGYVLCVGEDDSVGVLYEALHPYFPALQVRQFGS